LMSSLLSSLKTLEYRGIDQPFRLLNNDLMVFVS
jgi:hypothetical protein